MNEMQKSDLSEIDFSSNPHKIREALRRIWFDGQTKECKKYKYIAKAMSYFGTQEVFAEKMSEETGKEIYLFEVVVIEIHYKKDQGFFCWDDYSKPAVGSYLIGPVFALKLASKK